MMTPDSTPKQSDAFATSAINSEYEALKANTTMLISPPTSDAEDNDYFSGNDSSDDGDGDGIPNEFICPLTFEIFDDPLMTRAGHNFERTAIVSWLKTGHTTCPLTREPLAYHLLLPNSNLRMRVEKWKREKGYEIVHDVESERWKDRQFMFLMDCPPDSDLELRFNQNREEPLEQGRRRETRNVRGSRTTPPSQRRRLVGLLNAVRRTPLSAN
jgi:hypothetical protein